MPNNKNILQKIVFIVKDFKKYTLYLFFLVLAAALLEVLSLASLLPIIYFFFGKKTNPYIENFLEKINLVLEKFNIVSLNSFNLILLLVSLIFLFKFLFLIYLNFFRSYLNSRITYKITNNLFKKYLHQDYKFFFRRSSANLIFLINEVQIVILRVFSLLVDVSSDLLIALFIVIFLINYNSTITIFILSFFISVCFFYFQILKIIHKNYSFLRNNLNEKKINFIEESFHGVKEIKIFNLFNFVYEKFKQECSKLFNLEAKEERLRLSIRITIEFFLFILFIILIIFLSKNNQKHENILIDLVFFLVATSRILPIVNRLILNIQSIKSRISSLNSIYNDLNLSDNSQIQQNKNSSSIFKFNRAIIFKNVYYRYNNESKFIFKDLSFEIKKNKIVGITGPSGVGKSTLVDLMAGLLSPTNGNIFVDDKILTYSNSSKWMNFICYVPQFVFLNSSTILSNIAFLKKDEVVNKKLFKKSIQMACLEEFINNLPIKENTLIGPEGIKLSGGQRQRIGLARAFYKNAEIFIFDEATNALDDDNSDVIIKNIISLKKTVIFISHSQDILNKCDEIIRIEDLSVIINKKY
jgi:ABC-type bacteriocin/lantibiotic exporter with double-glycine peptidase domain